MSWQRAGGMGRLPLRHSYTCCGDTEMRRASSADEPNTAIARERVFMPRHDKALPYPVVKHRLLPSRKRVPHAQVMGTKPAGKLDLDRLREAMRAISSTQAGVANALGIKPQSVGQWFKTGRISKETLAKVAELSGFSVDYMLGATQDGPAPAQADPFMQGAALQALVSREVASQTRKLDGDIRALRGVVMALMDAVCSTPGAAELIRAHQVAQADSPEHLEKHFQGMVSQFLDRRIREDRERAGVSASKRPTARAR